MAVGAIQGLLDAPAEQLLANNRREFDQWQLLLEYLRRYDQSTADHADVVSDLVDKTLNYYRDQILPTKEFRSPSDDERALRDAEHAIAKLKIDGARGPNTSEKKESEGNGAKGKRSVADLKLKKPNLLPGSKQMTD